MTAVHPGRDGKLYPVTHLYRGASPDRAEAITIAHRLRCVLGYEYTAIQAELLAEHGIRRSRGSIFRDLHDFTCAECQDGMPVRGQHVTEPAAANW